MKTSRSARSALAPHTVYYDLRGFGGERMWIIPMPFAGTRADMIASAKSLQSRVWGGSHSHAGSLLIATDAGGRPRWRISPNLAVVEDISPVEGDRIAVTLAPGRSRKSAATRPAVKRNATFVLTGGLSGLASFSPTNHRGAPVQGRVTPPGERPGMPKDTYAADVWVGAQFPHRVPGWSDQRGWGLTMGDSVYDQRSHSAIQRAVARAYAAIDKGLGINVLTTVRKVEPNRYTVTASIDGGPSMVLQLHRADSGSREEWYFDIRRPPSGLSRDDHRSLVAALILGVERAIRRSHTRKSALTKTRFVALEDLYERL